MQKLDVLPVREFIEMVSDAGCELYACKASVDMFNLTKKDFCPQGEGIISAGTFYEISAGAKIICTQEFPLSHPINKSAVSQDG
jgi:predicted peroxiredoxin